MLILISLLAGATASAADRVAAEASLEQQVEALLQQNQQMLETIGDLQRDVQAARDEARAARETAAAMPARSPDEGVDDGAIFSRQVGRANFQLLDVSLDTLFAAGSSTASNDELETLQGGEHDPRQRGYTLQQVELSFLGAVDPYMTGEAHLVYFLDTDGESRFELEEAFLTSTSLPFGLDELGFQMEAGHFFTEFGRINPQHPHDWSWQDQPFALTRFFGGDGMRAPGLRVGWLTPLPWFSEIHFGMQNAVGETMVSFLANHDVFEERPIGGRPFADRDVDGPEDFAWLVRWVNGFDMSDTVSTQLGASVAWGGNATGDSAKTHIYGADWVLKWRPLRSDRGWPFVKFQTEFLYRNYEGQPGFFCEGDGCTPAFLPGETLEDWGLYAELLWGFRRNWAVGVRGEYGTGSGPNVEFDETGGVWQTVSRNSDPFRSDRTRVSPLVMFQATEFSRLRLQYNYDHADDLSDPSQHSLWAGVEFLFGSHPAHGY
jgi:hypothetical protein